MRHRRRTRRGARFVLARSDHGARRRDHRPCVDVHIDHEARPDIDHAARPDIDIDIDCGPADLRAAHDATGVDREQHDGHDDPDKPAEHVAPAGDVDHDRQPDHHDVNHSDDDQRTDDDHGPDVASDRPGGRHRSSGAAAATTHAAAGPAPRCARAGP